MIRDVTKDILIFALFLIIIGLVYYNVFSTHESNNIKYKYYSDDLITVDNDSLFEFHVNIVDNNYVAVLVSSDLTVSSIVSVSTVFYDEDGNQLVANKVSSLVFANSYGILTFPLPDLNDKYAGNIEINITGQETGNTESDDSNIKYQKTANDPFTIEVTNADSNSVSELEFSVVALKDKKIVLHETYFQESIMPYSTFSVSSDALTNMNGEYDELLIFTTSMDRE